MIIGNSMWASEKEEERGREIASNKVNEWKVVFWVIFQNIFGETGGNR